MTLHCTNCGASLAENAKFCASCGAAVLADIAPANPAINSSNPMSASAFSQTPPNDNKTPIILGVIGIGILIGLSSYFLTKKPQEATPKIEKTTSESVKVESSAPVNEIGLATPPIGAIAPENATQALNPNAQIAHGGQAMPETTYYVASRQINLRADANPNAAIIARLPFRSAIIANRQQTYIDPNTRLARIWVYVTFGTQSGWVNSSLLSQTPFTAPIDAAPPVQSVNRIYRFRGDCFLMASTETLNIRADANPNSRAIAKVGYGAEMECDNQSRTYIDPITGQKRDWYHVRYYGVVGWVNSNLVNVLD